LPTAACARTAPEAQPDIVEADPLPRGVRLLLRLEEAASLLAMSRIKFRMSHLQRKAKDGLPLG